MEVAIKLLRNELTLTLNRITVSGRLPTPEEKRTIDQLEKALVWLTKGPDKARKVLGVFTGTVKEQGKSRRALEAILP